MKLFLASKLANPTTWAKFLEFIGDTSNKRISYIVTAANAEGMSRWQKYSLTPYVLQLPSQSTSVVELENFRTTPISDQLLNSDIIISCGGYTGYLLYWLRFSQMDKVLIEVINKPNVIYAGSSSGSMVVSKTQFASEYLLSEPEPGASIFPGLGLVDFEIWPHFNEETESIEKIKSLHTWNSLYVLKDGEHILVDNENVNIFGEVRKIS